MSRPEGSDAPAGALWQRAAAFAARLHTGQVRKDHRTPYVSHPFRVAITVRHLFEHADDATICAAILHDTIEDTPADFDDIEKHFGPLVAEIVAALSKNMLLREDSREPEYDRRLSEADWRARLVKLADAYDNLCDIGYRSDGGPETVVRHLARCERAIALAEPDAGAHPETARAIGLLREAMSMISPSEA